MLELLSLSLVEGIGAKTLSKAAMNVGIDAKLEDYILFLQQNERRKQIHRIVSGLNLNEIRNRGKDVLDKCDELGVHIVTLNDDTYPSCMKKTVSPPPFLYVKGELIPNHERTVACIGTRYPSSTALSCIDEVVPSLVDQGWVVVSGLAIGCDARSHEKAVEAGGITWAFLAHGLDTVYPDSHIELAHAIMESGGALLSEYPPGVEPKQYHFTARDRLQAWSSQVVLPFETGVKGGTMHAVRAAMEENIPVVLLEEMIDRSQPLSEVYDQGIGISVTMSSLKDGGLDDILENSVPAQQSMF